MVNKNNRFIVQIFLKIKIKLPLHHDLMCR